MEIANQVHETFKELEETLENIYGFYSKVCSGIMENNVSNNPTYLYQYNELEKESKDILSAYKKYKKISEEKYELFRNSIEFSEELALKALTFFKKIKKLAEYNQLKAQLICQMYDFGDE